ncbi:MAG: PEP-CTERM sorting domain-containing protein [Betaproteobacteria bacterium]|nr:PEP-CTERM sorting domain-containing protein [Betaproteobacteria bacterium]
MNMHRAFSLKQPASHPSAPVSGLSFLSRCKRSMAPGSAAMGLLLAAIAPQVHALVPACTPQIGITEQVVEASGGAILAQYVMQTGDLCGQQIVALAIDNDESLAAFANLSGWNAQVVTDDFWDAGIVLRRDDLGSGTSYQITTGPQGVGSFASFFGPVAQTANLYWLSAHYGGPVVDNSTGFTAVGTPVPLPEDAFQFQTRALASTAIAFTQEGGAIPVSAVPEPASTAMLALGLGLLAVAGRRIQSAV